MPAFLVLIVIAGLIYAAAFIIAALKRIHQSDAH